MKSALSLGLAGLMLTAGAAFAESQPAQRSTTAPAPAVRPVMVAPQIKTLPAGQNPAGKATKASPIKDHTTGQETIGEAKDKPAGPNAPPPPPPPPPPPNSNPNPMSGKVGGAAQY